MNDALQQFARESLKEGVAQLPTDWQLTFRLMYSTIGVDRRGLRSPGVIDSTAFLEEPMNDLIDKMPSEKLDWAMQQVERSLARLSAETTL